MRKEQARIAAGMPVAMPIIRLRWGVEALALLEETALMGVGVGVIVENMMIVEVTPLVPVVTAEEVIVEGASEVEERDVVAEEEVELLEVAADIDVVDDSGSVLLADDTVLDTGKDHVDAVSEV